MQSKALMDIDNAYSFISHQVSSFTQAFHWYQVDWIKSVGKQLRNMWAGIFISKLLLKNILELKSIIIKKWQMLSVSSFDSGFGFHFNFFFAALDPPPPPIVVALFFFFLSSLLLPYGVSALKRIPLLPPLNSWRICYCFPPAFAIGIMMLLALLSNRYPQELQPGQELKK